MEHLPFRKRAAQALGLLVMAAGLPPILFGLSVLTGVWSFNFGHEGPPTSFLVLVLIAVPVGVLIIMGWQAPGVLGNAPGRQRECR